MSNHVHLVVIPDQLKTMALALKQTHGRYATFWNAAHSSSGHVWQGRFYSCPLDEPHLWIALRYAERNPVRAGLVARAELWNWSSAAAHCGISEPILGLDLRKWNGCWTNSSWLQYLAEGEKDSEVKALRERTHTGRPLGAPAFVAQMEQSTRRRLTPRKGGRPERSPHHHDSQRQLDF